MSTPESSAKPTQGDWKQHNLGIYSGHTLVGRACWANDCDANIHEQAHAPTSEYEAIANGRLLAAAKNAVEACQRLVKEWQEGGDISVGCFEDALQAVKQAEGRTK